MDRIYPMHPPELVRGVKRGLQAERPQSTISSASALSSATGVSSLDGKEESGKPGTRGRKPFEVSEEVDRGLVRILDSTDVSFDKLAQAVEDAGGPR